MKEGILLPVYVIIIAAIRPYTNGILKIFEKDSLMFDVPLEAIYTAPVYMMTDPYIMYASALVIPSSPKANVQRGTPKFPELVKSTARRKALSKDRSNLRSLQVITDSTYIMKVNTMIYTPVTASLFTMSPLRKEIKTRLGRKMKILIWAMGRGSGSFFLPNRYPIPNIKKMGMSTSMRTCVRFMNHPYLRFYKVSLSSCHGESNYK
jgi:hypothetical protein